MAENWVWTGLKHGNPAIKRAGVPSKTLQQNFNKIITPDKLNPHCQPKNLTFHNLCNEQKPPIGTKNLLGLNLKFCLAPNNLQKILTPLFLKWHVPLEFPIT